MVRIHLKNPEDRKTCMYAPLAINSINSTMRVNIVRKPEEILSRSYILGLNESLSYNYLLSLIHIIMFTLFVLSIVFVLF